MLETIEPFIDEIGVAAATSGLVGIALNPRRPRYVFGALVGIPLAFAFSDHVPDVAAYSLTGAYVGGLVGYAASSALKASQHAIGQAAIAAGAAGAAAIHPLLHYL